MSVTSSIGNAIYQQNQQQNQAGYCTGQLGMVGQMAPVGQTAPPPPNRLEIVHQRLEAELVRLQEILGSLSGTADRVLGCAVRDSTAKECAAPRPDAVIGMIDGRLDDLQAMVLMLRDVSKRFSSL